MPHSKLREIGRLLQEEESRFIGYSEIERKSKELGFPMTVRTLRFYVDEEILPPPKKVGKTPVYEEEWILNTLLGIHLMKTRLSRSLTEIRTILGRLQEEPAILADKLSVLYEEYAKSDSLKPLERASLIDAFFDLLTGRLGEARQASQIRLTDLAMVVGREGRWDGEEWVAPSPEAVLASQGVQPAEEAEEPAEAAAEEPPARDEQALDPAEEPDLPPAAALEPAPPGALEPEQARCLEETFIQRFESTFEVMGRVHCPLDGKGYKAGSRERTLLKKDRQSKIVDLMKRHRVYDRSLLDTLPRNELREYQVFQRSLFGRGDLKVVVAAIAISPLEAFIRQRWAREPLGVADAERALDTFSNRDDVFYYVGLLSTVGWTEEARERIPGRRNMLVSLVESVSSTAWRRHLVLDPRWAGIERVFDPESDQEKIDRVRDYLAESLRPKGEFLIVRNLPEDLDVSFECVKTAMDELMASDPQLEVVTSGGREIIKRSRL
jgi:DNA-binding transcriptional MerR regulator